MADTTRRKLEAWGLQALLAKYPGLRLCPGEVKGYKVAGQLSFTAQTNGSEQIEDDFAIEIVVPEAYPRQLPSVRETAGRVSKGFHKLDGGCLCLGSPTRLRLLLANDPSLLQFLEQCVIPYLYGFVLHERGGKLPFGELAHGSQGLMDDLREILGMSHLSNDAVSRFAGLLSLKRRVANKNACPCGSAERVSRCHHRLLNGLRSKLGRRWFALLVQQLK